MRAQDYTHPQFSNPPSLTNDHICGKRELAGQYAEAEGQYDSPEFEFK